MDSRFTLTCLFDLWQYQSVFEEQPFNRHRTIRFFPIRLGRFVATYSFALFCEISDLNNGFSFFFFCDVRFLTKRNLYSLDFSSLNRNNRSISCNIMQNLGDCCWLVHLFDACFQHFGINLTCLVVFSNFEYFR